MVICDHHGDGAPIAGWFVNVYQDNSIQMDDNSGYPHELGTSHVGLWWFIRFVRISSCHWGLHFVWSNVLPVEWVFTIWLWNKTLVQNWCMFVGLSPCSEILVLYPLVIYRFATPFVTLVKHQESSVAIGQVSHTAIGPPRLYWIPTWFPIMPPLFLVHLHLRWFNIPYIPQLRTNLFLLYKHASVHEYTPHHPSEVATWGLKWPSMTWMIWGYPHEFGNLHVSYGDIIIKGPPYYIPLLCLYSIYIWYISLYNPYINAIYTPSIPGNHSQPKAWYLNACPAAMRCSRKCFATNGGALSAERSVISLRLGVHVASGWKSSICNWL
jgi:hypothetical protein